MMFRESTVADVSDQVDASIDLTAREVVEESRSSAWLRSPTEP
jgi:hypothetical protein